MNNCFDLQHRTAGWCALTGLAWLLAAASAQAAVTAEDAWVREVPPSSPVAAAFVTLVNNGDQPVRVTAIESPLAGKVHWHDMTMNDGVMRMEVRARIILPAHSRVELQPGSSHLMLLGVRQSLAVGAKVPLIFRFERQPALTVAAVVRRSDGDDGAHVHQH